MKSSFRRKAVRAQEKILRKVGRNEKTVDCIFEHYVGNFEKQEQVAAKMKKTLKKHINCFQDFNESLAELVTVMEDVYEKDWFQHDHVAALLRELVQCTQQYASAIGNDVFSLLTSYQVPFAEVKKKIQQRNQRLVEFDYWRHQLEAAKTKHGPESKRLPTIQNEFVMAQESYMSVSGDLHDSLPALFDSRVPFYLSMFQSFFAISFGYHHEADRLTSLLSEIMDGLAEEFSKGLHSSKIAEDGQSTDSSESVEDEDDQTPLETTDVPASDQELEEPSTVPNPRAVEQDDPSQSPQTITVPTPPQCSESASADSRLGPPSLDTIDGSLTQSTIQTHSKLQFETRDATTELETSAGEHPETAEQSFPDTTLSGPTAAPDHFVIVEDASNSTAKSKKKNRMKTEAIWNTFFKGKNIIRNRSSMSSTSTDLSSYPEVIGYQISKDSAKSTSCELFIPEAVELVVSSYPYFGQNPDELSFEKGTKIHVLPKNPGYKLDEGWCLGVIDHTGEKGVFPRLFTSQYVRSN